MPPRVLGPLSETPHRLPAIVAGRVGSPSPLLAPPLDPAAAQRRKKHTEAKQSSEVSE